MTTLDDITFDETMGMEIQGWIMNLSGEPLDEALEKLELIRSGTQFAKADRLYRRLRGDYTANDFVRSEEDEDDVDTRNRRHGKLTALVRDLPFSERTMAEMTARREATARMYSARERHSSTPLTHAQTLPQPVDMSLTDVQINAIAPARTTTSTREEARDTQDIREAINLGRALAEGRFPPPLTTQSTWVNTITTTTTTPCVTTARTATTHTVHTMPQSVLTTRQTTSPDDLVQCTLTDGRTYTMPRAVACEMAKVQAIAREYDQEMRSLQNQMADLIASTRTHAIRNSTARTEASSQKSKTVNFQDTYRLEYIHEADSESDRRNALPHAQAQQAPALNARAPVFRPINDLTSQRGPLPTPQTLASNQHESWGRGSLPSHSRSRYSGEGTTLQQSMNLDVGRTVRQWKLQFTGEKGSNIEEFIERVNECRSLARIADEDLLNAMSELTSGVARHWCRQARKNWRTWEDFCGAARRCYGVDRRFQQRLVSEALARTQGKEEPVRDYIICLLAILSKFEEPWEDDRQLEQIYRNMLPALQRMVPRERVTDIDTLIELAREAEALLEAERNYKPPPSPDDSLLPDVAYKGPKSAKPQQQRNKGSSLAAMAECATSPPVEAKSEANAGKPSLAAIADQSPSALESLISRLLDEKLAKFALNLEQASKSSPRDAGSTRNTGAYRKNPRRTPEKRKDAPPGGTGDATYTAPTPNSDKNRNRSPGPKEHVRCWECSWPGYIKPTCPECSGKGRGSG